MKILLESSGSLTSAYLIRLVEDSGNTPVPSDIKDCFAKFICNNFIRIPKSNDKNLWKYLEDILVDLKIGLVLPSFDETLLNWSQQQFQSTKVIISPPETLDIFLNKYETYLFFTENNIPTPSTSNRAKYKLIKPVYGRGSKGIFLNESGADVNMNGRISQEFITGDEYTVDVLCDHDGDPVYIVPRKRLSVIDGKAVEGITVKHEKIIKYVEKICSKAHFIGPINIQCIECDNDEIKFIEINPRFGGGSALGIAATENWITLIVDKILQKKKIQPKRIKFNMKMYRYYSEVYA